MTTVITPRNDKQELPHFQATKLTSLGFPFMKWFGFDANPIGSSDKLSNWVNFMLWPMYSFGILALVKPVILFLFATFLISLTVYPDEGRSTVHGVK